MARGTARNTPAEPALSDEERALPDLIARLAVDEVFATPEESNSLSNGQTACVGSAAEARLPDDAAT